MRRGPPVALARIALTAVALYGLIGGVAAPETGTATIEVRTPWARASAGMAKTAAVYLTILNRGGSADRLVAATSPLARQAALHGHTMEGAVMRMRPVPAVEVGPGATAVLEPGGVHVMLTGLRAPLEAGQHFPLTLTFERAGEIQVEVAVAALGAPAPAHAQE